MDQVVLRFIAGQQQGKEFPLENDSVITIGRAEGMDLVIPEETVSRKHAIITAKNGEFILEDCSRNGTYVNGRQVQHTLLHPRDQIHIGRSILKVMVFSTSPVTPTRMVVAQHPVLAGTASVSSPALLALGNQPITVQHGGVAMTYPPPTTAVVTPPPVKSPPVGTSTTEHFRGSLADIALTDLIQLLSSSRKTGDLVLRSHSGVGRIFLDKGQISYATLDDTESVSPHKVFYRLLRWNEGTFEFESPSGRQFASPISETTEFLLLEAMHQLDEINNLGPNLPSLRSTASLMNPLPAPLRELSPGELDFIQLVLRHKTVGTILDHYAGSDFEGYTYLKSLVARKFLVVAAL